MLGSLIGAAGIGAGASLIGSGIGAIGQNSTNKTNMKIAEMANKANQQLQDTQNQWNLEQWQRENDYTSAESQRKRLEAAGYNPYLASGQVASGNATTAETRSAPYTPTVTPQYQSPMSGLGAGVTNAANDFVSNYNNIRMANANVTKSEAEAEQAMAYARALSGYKADESRSTAEKNKYQGLLAQSQTELNKINAQIQAKFGSAQAAANIENAVNAALESKSRTIKNEHEAYKIVADTIQSEARTNNLNVSSNQIKAMTALLVEKLEKENEALGIQNKMSDLDYTLDKEYKHTERSYGVQSLGKDIEGKEQRNKYQKKENQFYWWDKTSNKAFQLIDAIIPFK